MRRRMQDQVAMEPCVLGDPGRCAFLFLHAVASLLDCLALGLLSQNALLPLPPLAACCCSSSFCVCFCFYYCCCSTVFALGVLSFAFARISM